VSGRSPEAVPAAPPRARRRRRWRRLLLGAVALFVLLELAVRVVISLPPWSRPFFAAPRHIVYPELAAAEELPPAGEAATIEVLVLGGSTLDPVWSDVALRLQRKLQEALAPAPVLVHDLARAGQTTLDTLYKLRHLQERHFDAIVVYDGINDVRFNNCPPELFRRDYGQLVWYRVLAGFEPSPDEPLAEPPRSPFMLPTALRHLGLSIALRCGWLHAMTPGMLTADWLQWGADLRTRDTYAANLRGVLALARQSDTPLVLPAFATYVVPDYERTAFEAGRLDYAPGGLPIERWGAVQDVLDGLRAHDQIVRALAGEPGVLLVDTSAVSAEGGRAFVDVCHFTARGSAIFATLLADALQPLLARED